LVFVTNVEISAAGCPLTQTLIEAGLKVLLVERGSSEPPVATHSLQTVSEAQQSSCAEYILSSDGVAIGLGNCIGGATSVNYGAYIEETVQWIKGALGEEFGTEEEILAAQDWVSVYQLFRSRRLVSSGP